MTRESVTTEVVQKSEVPESHKDLPDDRSPDELRQAMISESRQEVDDFVNVCADDISQVEARAKKDKLTIDDADEEVLRKLRGKAMAARDELAVAVGLEGKEIPPVLGAAVRKLYEICSQGKNEVLPEVQALARLMMVMTEDEKPRWKPPAAIDAGAVQEMLPKIDAAFERLNQAREAFGDSLEVLDPNTFEVQQHLADFSQLPIDVIRTMGFLGLKVKIGNADVVGLSGDESLKQGTPRGWAGKEDGWQGVAGAYCEGTVYAGTGKYPPDRLALHEYGHGMGDKLRLDDALPVMEAHERLFAKLPLYEQQGGPRGHAGRQEFLAQSIQNYWLMPEQDFVDSYDKEWHGLLTEVMSRKLDSRYEKFAPTLVAFGKSLEIAAEADPEMVQLQLAELSSIPDGVIRSAKRDGLKVKIGQSDIGKYDRSTRTVSGGKGENYQPGDILSQYDDGVGDVTGLANAQLIKDARARLIDKFPPEQQPNDFRSRVGGPKFFAESFKDFLQKPKAEFVAAYDEQWHNDFGNFVMRLEVLHEKDVE